MALKFSQNNPSEIFLSDEGTRVSRIQPVDTLYNGGDYYQPTPRISEVALHAVSSFPAATDVNQGASIRSKHPKYDIHPG